MDNNKLSWKCINNCGACCRLDPKERVDAISLLTEDQQRIYFDLIDDQGWCKHLDKASKKCTIYETRPDFCHVSFINAIYDIDKMNKTSFSISNCRSHIKSIYGKRSKLIRRYERAIRSGG